MIINVSKSTKINGVWQKIELKNTKNVYLIAIKDDKSTKKDLIDCKNIKQVRFELAIESGIKEKPLTIRYINLNFDDITSGDNKINERTGFVKLIDIPSNFYIRVSSIDDGFKSIKDGNINLTININEID